VYSGFNTDCGSSEPLKTLVMLCYVNRECHGHNYDTLPDLPANIRAHCQITGKALYGPAGNYCNAWRENHEYSNIISIIRLAFYKINFCQ